MTTFELEPGDTGQAILPAPGSPSVKDQGAQWLPEGTDPVWGDVWHHRERIDQLSRWVRYWKARADRAEGRVARVEAVRNEWDAGMEPVHHRGYIAGIDRALGAGQ